MAPVHIYEAMVTGPQNMPVFNDTNISPEDLTRFLAEQLSTAHWFDQRETRRALGWTPAVSLDEGFERLRLSYAAAR
ncbi:hypothetical protein CMMCAS05_04795 [Clavibacter michiganensis subsp. michiganensis]|nr:hypothetical protein CMMCAS05_04795 [Clavibacter michiganensis subsp. michiganensis]